MRIFFVILLVLMGCQKEKAFEFNLDYRNDPIAVDCEDPKDVSLIFEHEGMQTKKITGTDVTSKTLVDRNGKKRTVCIFNDMSLREFCEYKGPKEVGPYWVSEYQKIDAAKCSEVLK